MTQVIYDFLICSEAGVGSWHQGSLDSILDELRRAYDILVRDDVLERAVEQLQFGMQGLVDVLSGNIAACTRLAQALGVYQAEVEENRNDE